MLSAQDNSGHRERLRSRLEIDPLSVADYEILELILGLSIKRMDTKPLAKELLLRFGNIRGCLDATVEELRQVPGFGKSLSSLWQLLREVRARYEAAPFVKKLQLSTPETVAKMAMARLGHLAYEECWAAFLNTQHFLISWERLSRGGINYSTLQPREIIERALLIKAASFIIVHNHPGGISTPSKSDLKFTAELFKIAQMMSIPLLDHLIVTSHDYFSFEKENLLLNSGGQNG